MAVQKPCLIVIIKLHLRNRKHFLVHLFVEQIKLFAFNIRTSSKTSCRADMWLYLSDDAVSVQL